MHEKLRVLIAEDTEDDALLLLRALRKGGFDPDSIRIWTEEGLLSALSDDGWDIILTDYHMPGFGGDNLIRTVRERGYDIPIIIVSGAIGEEAAVSLLKDGAADYVMKDNLIRLIPSVNRALLEARDRQERRRAEDALRDSEERYRSMMRQISEGILLIDRNTRRIIESNEMSSRILGFKERDLLRMTIDGIAEGFFPTDLRKSRIFEGGILTPDGRSIDLEVSISPISIKDCPDGVSAVIRDISEKKDLERRQIKAFLQIDHNIEQFAILADHIRNPLQVILGYSILSEDATSEEVMAQVYRINDIIRQLDHGWIESENVRQFLRRNYRVGDEPGDLR
ncbi:response regulator [Methanocalculus chunghsingensis]|uniref:response regulator n=1 Tax=Methanocalculus chunghsingensis TaxID=156457 RepID=UPI001B8A9ED3|nr:response regulator [Methanocalculus chunghsingensis]